MNSHEMFAALDDVDSPNAMASEFKNAADALRFMLAGHAIVTLRSKKTMTRFTYKLTKSDDGRVIFVGLLRGPDNTEDYSYLGYIRRDVYFHGGAKAKISVDADSAKAFDWSYRQLVKGAMPPQLEVWHEGSCGCCGRVLTVPESVASGFGPTCAARLGIMIERPERKTRRARRR